MSMYSGISGAILAGAQFIGGGAEQLRKYDAEEKKIQEKSDQLRQKRKDEVLKSKWEDSNKDYNETKKKIKAIESAGGITSLRGQWVASGMEDLDDYVKSSRADPELFYPMPQLGDAPVLQFAELEPTQRRSNIGKMLDDLRGIDRPEVEDKTLDSFTIEDDKGVETSGRFKELTEGQKEIIRNRNKNLDIDTSSSSISSQVQNYREYKKDFPEPKRADYESLEAFNKDYKQWERVGTLILTGTKELSDPVYRQLMRGKQLTGDMYMHSKRGLIELEADEGWKLAQANYLGQMNIEEKEQYHLTQRQKMKEDHDWHLQQDKQAHELELERIRIGRSNNLTLEESKALNKVYVSQTSKAPTAQEEDNLFEPLVSIVTEKRPDMVFSLTDLRRYDKQLGANLFTPSGRRAFAGVQTLANDYRRWVRYESGKDYKDILQDLSFNNVKNTVRNELRDRLIILDKSINWSPFESPEYFVIPEHQVGFGEVTSDIRNMYIDALKRKAKSAEKYNTSFSPEFLTSKRSKITLVIDENTGDKKIVFNMPQKN